MDESDETSGSMVDKQFQVTDKAKKFLEVMDKWFVDESPDAEGAMLSAGACLSEWGQEVFGGAQYESKVAIVGDESSGKTTFATRLLETITMVMGEETATKCRTKVTATYVPGLNYTKCDFTYKSREVRQRNITPNELFTSHIATFRDENISSNLCEIRINMAKPSAGIGIIDHPGFVAHNAEVTGKCFEDTMKELYKGETRAQFASVVLVHAANARAEQAHFVSHADTFREVPEGKLYVCVTKADRLNVGDIWQQRVRPHLETKGGRRNAANKYECTPWDIMKIVMACIRNPLPTKPGTALPDHAKVYFVCGFSKSVELLKSGTEADIWKLFDENCRENEGKLKKIFLDKTKWEEESGGEMELKDMSKEEEIQFNNHIGFDHLQKEICSSQSECWKAVIKSLQSAGSSGSMASKINGLELRLREAHNEMRNSPKMGSIMLDFLSMFNTLYCNIASGAEIYTAGGIGSEDSEGKKAMWEDINKVYSHLSALADDQDLTTATSEIGFTLAEEHEIFHDMNRQGTFPPKNRSLCILAENGKEKEDAFNAAMKHDLIHSTDVRLYRLNDLLYRFQSEYAVLSQKVCTPKFTEKHLMAKTKNSPGSSNGDLKEAVSKIVKDEYRNIYLERRTRGAKNLDQSDAGNIFVANRVALAHILHGQTILEILAKVHYFRAIFDDDVDPGVPFQLDQYLKDFSRYQQENHPVNFGGRASDEVKFEEIDLLELIEGIQNDARKIWIVNPAGDDNDDEQKTSYGGVNDILQVLIAQFFDQIYGDLLEQLDARTQKLFAVVPSFFAASMHFDQCFIHQDRDFLEQYVKHRPEEYWCANLSPVNLNGQEDLKDEDADSFIGKSKSTKPVINAEQDTAGDLNEPFAHIKDLPSVRSVAACGNKLHNADQLDRAYLVANLINMQQGPDIVMNNQAAGKLFAFEEQSINYVIQRSVSAGVKSTMDDIILNIAATGYLYSHPVTMATHAQALEERLLSLCLGYNYPYLTKDQPRRFRHLSIDVVIQFLNTWKKELILEGKEANTGIEVLQGLIHGTSLESHVWKSHLFQAVCSKLYKCEEGKLVKDEQGAKKMSAKIAIWHEKWLSDNKNDHDILRKDVLAFLLDCRYSSSPGGNAAEREINELTSLLTEWSKLTAYLKSFSDFVSKHGEDLVNGDEKKKGEKKHIRPVKPSPTSFTPTFGADPSQAPMEAVRTKKKKPRGRGK